MTLKELLEKYDGCFEDPGSVPEEDDTARYVMVQENRDNGSIYLTTHHTIRDAEHYADGEECPENWETVLHDTETGETLAPETKTTFYKPEGWKPALPDGAEQCNGEDE